MIFPVCLSPNQELSDIFAVSHDYFEPKEDALSEVLPGSTPRVTPFAHRHT